MTLGVEVGHVLMGAVGSTEDQPELSISNEWLQLSLGPTLFFRGRSIAMRRRAWVLVWLSVVAHAYGCGQSNANLLTPGLDAGPDASPPCAEHAAEFNGSAHLSLPRPVQDDFTLEAGIRTSESRSGSAFYHGSGLIYADAPPGDNPLGANDFGSAVLNERFAFGVGNPDTTLDSLTKITSGEWIHVAATRAKNAGESRVFVNGSLEGSVVSMQTGSLLDQPTLVIGNTTVNDRHFTGVMDEVRVWDTVRSARDIESTLHRQLAGDEEGLVAYWQFDDVGGSVASDSSSSKNDAMVVGPLEWIVSDAPVCNEAP